MSKFFWTNYLFHADFSDVQASLANLPPGPISQANATLLAALLSTHDTGEGRALWTDKAGADWSLFNASVIYNAGNKLAYPTKYLHNHVLILEFSANSATPQAGARIYLQYDVPGAAPTIATQNTPVTA